MVEIGRFTPIGSVWPKKKTDKTHAEESIHDETKRHKKFKKNDRDIEDNIPHKIDEIV